MKQLIILAGGKGSRLKERLGKLPKPLIDICGKPLLEHQILLAKAHGFKDLIITVCHEAEAIREFCGDGSRWSVNIRYLEEKQPLGTAGAILVNLATFADTFMVMYGDTLLNVDLSRFWDFHLRNKAEASLFLHPNDHPHDSDLVEIDSNGRIVAFHPYPHAADRYFPNLVNAALYLVQKSSLEKSLAEHDFSKAIDFVKDLFPQMLKQNRFLLGYPSTEYIKDAGTPKRVDQVCADFLSGKIQRRALTTPNTALFIDRDGTLTQETDYVTTPDQLQLIPGSADGIKRINQSGHLAILVTNQPVIARGSCSEDQLKQIHNKLETLLGQEGAFLDAIYYCPHHPDKGFAGERIEYKIRCDCRKPGLGMLKQAQQLATIDLKNSWLIGDSSVDMQTAKNAGLKSVLVRTGFSGCDDKYAARPDFECYNLTEAVTFILDKFPALFKQAQTQTAQIQAGDRIVIGGLARSGKSTWATLMKLALAERQIDATIISLDGWIKDIDQRGDGKLMSRHDTEALKEVIQKLAAGTEIQIPSYNRLQRKRNKLLEQMPIKPEQVIIFEGVIAFLIEDFLTLKAHHFYIKSSDTLRIDNFHKEYSLRGLSEKEIHSLYQSREEDENQLIKASPMVQNAIWIEETE